MACTPYRSPCGLPRNAEGDDLTPASLVGNKSQKYLQPLFMVVFCCPKG